MVIKDVFDVIARKINFVMRIARLDQFRFMEEPSVMQKMKLSNQITLFALGWQLFLDLATV